MVLVIIPGGKASFLFEEEGLSTVSGPPAPFVDQMSLQRSGAWPDSSQIHLPVLGPILARHISNTYPRSLHLGITPVGLCVSNAT